MERILSDEEKIRRAIEISKRRSQNQYQKEKARVDIHYKKDYRLFKKMILQIIICLLIYIIFQLISTTNYIFSDELIKNTNNILNYDINFKSLYEDCYNFFITIFESNVNDENMFNINNSSTDNNMLELNLNSNSVSLLSADESINNIIINNVENTKQDKENNKSNHEKKEENVEKTAMELDAEEVKKICKFKKPLSGTITSEFGDREATIKGMTTDHKGIDIAANSGTNIKAAINGTVSVAEQNSEYGKFIKIINGDVTTVYAHCKSLKVKKGDKIKIGQTIATVGSTGTSTGPHLHFEIRFKNRYINPRLVIKF